MNGKMVVGGVSDRSYDIRQRSRSNYARWAKLVDASVARVQLREDIITADVALQQTAKIFLDSLLFWIHECAISICGARFGSLIRNQYD
jgi:hypothetical protein